MANDEILRLKKNLNFFDEKVRQKNFSSKKYQKFPFTLRSLTKFSLMTRSIKTMPKSKFQRPSAAKNRCFSLQNFSKCIRTTRIFANGLSNLLNTIKRISVRRTKFKSHRTMAFRTAGEIDDRKLLSSCDKINSASIEQFLLFFRLQIAHRIRSTFVYTDFRDSMHNFELLLCVNKVKDVSDGNTESRNRVDFPILDVSIDCEDFV